MTDTPVYMCGWGGGGRGECGLRTWVRNAIWSSWFGLSEWTTLNFYKWPLKLIHHQVLLSYTLRYVSLTDFGRLPDGGLFFCLLWNEKVRTTWKTYISVSVWWKSKLRDLHVSDSGYIVFRGRQEHLVNDEVIFIGFDYHESRKRDLKTKPIYECLFIMNR
jgi:hypothetical protein